MSAAANKHCDTCKSYIRYGQLCDDVRHVRELDPDATYVSTTPMATCEYWIASPLLKSVEAGARPAYRNPSSRPEIFSTPEATNDR